MRINEVVMQEAVYSGMMWLEEAYLFFSRAPENLQQEVEDMLENDQEAAAKKVIAEFLGIKAEGHVSELNENPEAISALKQTISDPHTDPGTRKAAQQKLAKIMKDIKAASDDATFQKRANLAKKKFSDVGAERKKGMSSSDKAKKVWDLSKESVAETATAGATSAGNIASIANPHLNKPEQGWAGKPGKMAKKGPPQPQGKQKKNADGTAKGAHELKGASLFGGPAIKR